MKGAGAKCSCLTISGTFSFVHKVFITGGEVIAGPNISDKDAIAFTQRTEIATLERWPNYY